MVNALTCYFLSYYYSNSFHALSRTTDTAFETLNNAGVQVSLIWLSTFPRDVFHNGPFTPALQELYIVVLIPTFATVTKMDRSM